MTENDQQFILQIQQFGNEEFQNKLQTLKFESEKQKKINVLLLIEINFQNSPLEGRCPKDRGVNSHKI
jgi:hypothetical protein